MNFFYLFVFFENQTITITETIYEMAKTKQKERISIQLKNGASETSPVNSTLL